jgi:hypothetical protein
MPHYVARVELGRYQGRDPLRRDYAKLDEVMSKLLFDHTLSAGKLELPAGTYIGSSFDACDTLGQKLAEAVLAVWPAPKIIVGPMSACWSYGLSPSQSSSILSTERKQA